MQVVAARKKTVKIAETCRRVRAAEDDEDGDYPGINLAQVLCI